MPSVRTYKQTARSAFVPVTKGFPAVQAQASVQKASLTSPTREPARHPTGLDVTASVARNAAAVGKGVTTFGHLVADPIGAKAIAFGAKTLPALGKLALPLTAVAAGGAAMLEGYKGYQKDGVSGAVKGAIRGAADSFTMGIASWAFDAAMAGNSQQAPAQAKEPEGSKIPDATTRNIVSWAQDNRGGSPAPKLTSKEASQFSGANQSYAAKQKAQQSKAPDQSASAQYKTGNTKRGTQNEANLKSIIANKQAKSLVAQE